ncbi:hypothetical protein [Glycomyces halotolerans]
MAHRREQEAPRSRRIKTWGVGTAVLAAVALAAVLAVLTLWP